MLLSYFSATVQDIVDALKSMGCAHALQANQIEDLDCVAVYPAVHWLVSLVNTKQHKNGHVVTTLWNLTVITISIACWLSTEFGFSEQYLWLD